MTQATTLSKNAQEELLRLTPHQRRVVLVGLWQKLQYLHRIGRLSYRYDVCPVCRDVGSTQDEPRCHECYIETACQAPFVEGFRDNQELGAQYFQNMWRFLMSEKACPKCLVVGGDWNSFGGRPSKIAAALADSLEADLFNGGHVRDLPRLDIQPYPVVVWIPNVSNQHEKHYPRKARCAVLVVSKVMHEGVQSSDAAARIFKMRGNAVIEICPPGRIVGNKMVFRLVDALSNQWGKTADATELGHYISDLVAWTLQAKRVPSVQSDQPPSAEPPEELPRLLVATRQLADQIETAVGTRYFGNVSTRCMKLFPSAATGPAAYVSPRNTDKHRIEPEDMVLAWMGDKGCVAYRGDRKPSIDTAIQLHLYQRFPWLRFLIHGHAYAQDAPFTDEYFPCGDLREVAGTVEAIQAAPAGGVVNLRDHGFLLYGDTIQTVEELATTVCFHNRL